jgi:hypothetical protein
VLSSLRKKGAEKWLQVAITLSNIPDEMKLLALEQPELERIWAEER